MIKFTYEGTSKKLSRVIFEEYPKIGYSSLQKLFRKSDIKINGKRISSDLVLQTGDEIIIYYNEPVFSPEILYEDENIITFYKPKKIKSQGSNSFEEKIHSKFPTLILCHRLDMNTEGILLFAKTDDVFEEIKKQFKAHTIQKKYYALVAGEINESGFYKDYILKRDDEKKVYVYNAPKDGAKEAILSFTPIKKRDGCTLVDVSLITGRMHQIRAQFAYHGHPVIGDDKYGDERTNMVFQAKSQKLIAYKMFFSIKSGPLHYLNGKEIVIHDIKI